MTNDASPSDEQSKHEQPNQTLRSQSENSVMIREANMARPNQLVAKADGGARPAIAATGEIELAAVDLCPTFGSRRDLAFRPHAFAMGQERHRPAKN
jgi:hypothetical protein